MLLYVAIASGAAHLLGGCCGAFHTVGVEHQSHPLAGHGTHTGQEML